MALLPSFPPPDTGAPERARSRLAALSSAVVPAADAATQSEPEDADPLTATRGGRLVRWWLPTSLRDARWEPGRPGALILSLVAAMAAVIAAIGVWRERPMPEPAPMLPLVAATAAPDPTGPPGPTHEVVVSVLGRVARPGLIRLPEGKRVADALDAAGGAVPGTDLMGLNIARRLSDGEQLLVGVAPPPGQPPTSQVPGSPGGPATVDLNAASLEQLDGLPGVGKVTAQRILDWREAHGRFTSVDQLREVSGIGPARLAQLKRLVRV